jgi:exodeoxyribonuclease VII large subunit
MELFPNARPNAPEPEVFSVTELTQTVRAVLQQEIGDVWVEGEVSNYRKQGSGHQYFTLKDAQSQLSCVQFARPGLWRKPVPLTDGMHIIARGQITVYEARGQYQLNVQQVQIGGAGALQAKFEALKRRLEAEGLFDPARKRALPPFPRAVGIVTSATGAALRDMLNILERRAPWMRVVVSPVRVQGSGAAIEIAAAIAELNEFEAHGIPPVDVLVVARGGGSVEDLWEFNEEVVARAIVASGIPVVSAVGHEIDFTIADFAADLRAPTPSAAAELIAPDTAELERGFERLRQRMQRCASAGVARQRQHVISLGRTSLFQMPRARLDEAAQRLDHAADLLRRCSRAALDRLRHRLTEFETSMRQHRPDQQIRLRQQHLTTLVPRLQQAYARSLADRRHRLAAAAEKLRLLSPEAILSRGYAVVYREDGTVVRSVTQVTAGSVVKTRVADGTFQAEVR